MPDDRASAPRRRELRRRIWTGVGDVERREARGESEIRRQIPPFWQRSDRVGGDGALDCGSTAGINAQEIACRYARRAVTASTRLRE